MHPKATLAPFPRGEVRAALNDQLPQVLGLLRQVGTHAYITQKHKNQCSCENVIHVLEKVNTLLDHAPYLPQALQDGRGSHVHALGVNALKAWVEFGLPWEYVWGGG